MYNPLPHLPFRLQMFIRRMKTSRISPRVVFFVLGFLATVWFLIRVIPKPSRAAYPCMRATAPFMSAFIIYLMSAGGAVLALKKTGHLLQRRQYPLAALFVVLAVGLLMVSDVQFPSLASARSTQWGRNYFVPNQPIGEAKGIIPGRVVWTWDADATNINCSNTSNNNGVIDDADDAWFMASNNNEVVIDTMIARTVRGLTGSSSNGDAWDALFNYFNTEHGYGATGYASGQKILLKINGTSAYGGVAAGRYHDDLSRTDLLSVNSFAAETNPFVVLCLLRQLIEEAQVPPSMIYVGDPARNIYKEHYDLWHNRFPDVHFLGNNLRYTELNILALGRTPVAVTETDRVFFSDHGSVMPDAVSDKLFTIFDEIDYLINIPTMKAHATAGITLAAKNHFGSFTREWAMHLHKGLMDNVDDPARVGYGLYRVQTDLMMHNLLGGKNLLILIDALYPGDDALGVPTRWSSFPFSGDWCSSVLASLDPVAIESVCHDFLRSEYNGTTLATSRPNWYGVDDYLHQAADSSQWADGIVYDPDNDGVIIASLGVHEHWNDSVNKQYTRNLGTGDGIDLYKTHEVFSSSPQQMSALVAVFPNPTSGLLTIANSERQQFKFTMTDAGGRLLFEGLVKGNEKSKVDLTAFANGTYFLLLQGEKGVMRHKIVKF